MPVCPEAANLKDVDFAGRAALQEQAEEYGAQEETDSGAAASCGLGTRREEGCDPGAAAECTSQCQGSKAERAARPKTGGGPFQLYHESLTYLTLSSADFL